MKVKYVGSCADGVVLPSVFEFAHVVLPGGVIDVDDATGVTLCEQAVNWEPGDAKAVKLFDEFCVYALELRALEAEPVAATSDVVAFGPAPTKAEKPANPAAAEKDGE